VEIMKDKFREGVW